MCFKVLSFFCIYTSIISTGLFLTQEIHTLVCEFWLSTRPSAWFQNVLAIKIYLKTSGPFFFFFFFGGGGGDGVKLVKFWDLLWLRVDNLDVGFGHFCGGRRRGQMTPHSSPPPPPATGLMLFVFYPSINPTIHFVPNYLYAHPSYHSFQTVSFSAFVRSMNGEMGGQRRVPSNFAEIISWTDLL